MRWRAEEVLTRELGPRSDLEMDRQRAVYVAREAPTPIERALAHYQSAEGKVTLERLATAQPTERVACLGRLATLARLGLATREGPAQWHMSTGWQRELEQLGQRSEMGNRVYRAIPGSAGQFEHVEPGRAIPGFEGVVRAIGLHDEQSGNLYAVVEPVKGYPRYVQVPPDAAQTIRVGDKGGDPHLAGPIDGSSRATSGSAGSRRGTMGFTTPRSTSERSKSTAGARRRWVGRPRPSWSGRTSGDWNAWNGTDLPNAKRMDPGACRRI